jgi:hypothetical protein
MRHRWQRVGPWRAVCLACDVERRGTCRAARHGNRKIWIDEYSADRGATWIEARTAPPCPRSR